MGLTSSIPSYTYDQIYLPADCFRVCSPDACFCRGAHHTRSKYVYVERNNPSGRETYRDPVEFMDRFVNAAGSGGGFPGGGAGGFAMLPPAWAQPGVWRPRDYDVMSRVLGQYMAQQRGIMDVPWAEMGGGPFVGGTGPPPPPGWPAWGPWGPPPWQQHQQAAAPAGFHGGGGFLGGGPWGKKGLAEAIDEATRAQNERVKEMFDQVQSMSDCLFGSPAELREKRFEQGLLRHLQPLVPELAKLIAMQQMGLVGGGGGAGGIGGMGMGMMGSGGMNAPPMMGGMGPQPGMGMGGMNPMMGAGGMGGMGPMNPMMNPFAMGGGGMPGMTPLMAGGADPGLMAGAGDMGGGLGRRRPRPRRAMRDFDMEDDDDDLDFGRGRGGFGRRRRRGRFDDLDDLLGDRGGDGSRSPRGPLPPRGPRRPRPNLNGNGSGGAVFDTFADESRYSTAPLGVPVQPSPTTSQNVPPPPAPTMPPAADPIPPPDRILTPEQGPLHTSPPPMPIPRPPSGSVTGFPPTGSIPIPDSGEGNAPPYRPFPSGTFDMPAPPMYPGAPVGDNRAVRPNLGGSRRVSFRPEAGLARPREDEENRGEPEAGGPAARRDI